VLAQGVISWDSPLKTCFSVEKPKPVVPDYTDEEGVDSGGASRKGSEESSMQVRFRV
jgi:hypothetical protein